jgi:hypothetical protein
VGRFVGTEVGMNVGLSDGGDVGRVVYVGDGEGMIVNDGA